MNQNVELNGFDLYRLNCRGCHGEKGLGAPPEINSVINPVRATSASLVIKRMRDTGIDMAPAQAAQMAAQARTALSERLHKGGENMPAFGYLREPEVRSLMPYLEELAEVPGYRQSSVQESHLRVGELIVRSTCHICHDATGENPTPEQILQGAIPPLSSLTSRVNEAQLVRKVIHGAPVVMGAPAMLERGRMPVFYYLTPDEAADVYSYLTAYPPQPSPDEHFRIADGKSLAVLVTASDSLPAATRPLTESVDGHSVVLMLAMGAFVVLLIIGGLLLSVSELARLSAQKEKHLMRPESSDAQGLQVCSK